MSPYSSTLAQARLDALEALVQALKDAETPDEKRRCAVAIFNAPDPCDLDDSIEWNDEEATAEEADTENLESDSEASNSESTPAPDTADTIPALAPPRATASPAALSGQAVRACNGEVVLETPPNHTDAPPSLGTRNSELRTSSAPDPLILAMQHLNSLLDAAGVPPVSDEEAEAYLDSLRLPLTSAGTPPASIPAGP